MSEFIIYQKFDVREEALELGAVLHQKDIPYKLETGESGFDPSFVFKDEFRILLRPADFEKVNALFTQNVEDDYYLFSFSDKELIEITEKQDEWSHFDFILAQKIMKDRGLEISQETIQTFQENRILELRKPEKSEKYWIVFGYLMAFLGGVLGLFIGWSLLSSTVTLPNGEKVHRYNESDRNHGRTIVMVSAISVSLLFILRVYYNIQKQL